MLHRKPTWALLLASTFALYAASCTEVPLRPVADALDDDAELSPSFGPSSGAAPDAAGLDPGSSQTSLFDAGPQLEAPDASDRDSGPVLPPGCTVPSEVNNAPRSYAEMLAFINALPRPATIACFLQALARPLEVNLTLSFVSAQPAVGSRSPRIFIFYDPMIYSVVPDGVGALLLEMSYLTSETRSVKAEVVFPLTDALDEAIVADHIRRETGTICRLCHAGESEAEGSEFFEGMFESDALRPRDVDLVSLAELSLQAASCDPAVEPERCEILHALLDYGPIVERTFPEAMRTFF